ncbi:MAG: replication-associated recombination protein A, partial [Synergistaceae bacterium]|nr:replication-associated recombination protein A [Synergistaceae bacterium]
MRPVTMEEYAGQGHILGPGKPLRVLLENGRVPSCILYGNPGVGKTTLVRLMASATGRRLLEINAVSAKVSQIRDMMEEAASIKARSSGRTAIAFVDEIYHLNSSQQNVLLPSVERGDIILVGTTSENPWFEINKTLLSRMIVYTLQPLDERDVTALLGRALADEARGLGALGLAADDDALPHIARLTGGDARQALTRLETAATGVAMCGGTRLTIEAIDEATGRQTLRYDRAGTDHYAVISALIKSVRGSDPDAALYWLARMLASGDDVRFICRRLCILAAEDIGLADPTALIFAEAASSACDRVGLPEAKLILGEAVIYLAAAPKSNSAYKAISAAEEAVASGDIMEVPSHL